VSKNDGVLAEYRPYGHHFATARADANGAGLMVALEVGAKVNKGEMKW